MELSKEEIKKIVVGVLGLIGVTYGYTTFLLDPLQSSQTVANSAITDLQPKITTAKAQLKRTADAEAAAPLASLTTKQLTSLIQDGSPVAWFPPQVADFFKREGIEKVTTHMNAEAAEKDLAGFKRISWSIEVPRVEFMTFAQALADFENEQLLTEVANVQIDTLRQDVEAQHINLTINSILKQ